MDILFNGVTGFDDGVLGLVVNKAGNCLWGDDVELINDGVTGRVIEAFSFVSDSCSVVFLECIVV